MRPVLAALLLLVLPAAEEASIWERFAGTHYQGGDNLGRSYYRGAHLSDLRAPGSWVGSQEHRISDQEAAKIRGAVNAVAPLAGAAIPPDKYEAWSGDGAGGAWVVVTFCTEVDRPEKGMIEIYVGDEKQRIAAYADRLDAVIWLRGEEAVVLRSSVRPGAGKEMDACPVWDPFDVVDIDRDGDPEVVLLTTVYEGHHLEILSVRGSEAVHRWSGLGSGL